MLVCRPRLLRHLLGRLLARLACHALVDDVLGFSGGKGREGKGRRQGRQRGDRRRALPHWDHGSRASGLGVVRLSFAAQRSVAHTFHRSIHASVMHLST